MIWVWVIGLCLAAFAALAWGLKAPRKGWEAIGAALAVGLAGFAFQAGTSQPGAPKEAVQEDSAAGQFLVEERVALSGMFRDSAQPDRWLLTADGLTRNGAYSDAAGWLLGAVEENPKNSEAWVALGNNLLAHADGQLTPAALEAYRKGAEADPQSPLPPYFLGLALARGGKLQEARKIWAEVLTKAPGDAPWRGGLTARLAQIEALIAQQSKQSQ